MDASVAGPRPSRRWYAVGPLVLVVGIVVAAVLNNLSQRIPEPVSTFHTGESVEVELAEDGLTILLGDGWEPGAHFRCLVRDSNGEEVTLTYGLTSLEVTHDGTDWHPAYKTSYEQPPGTYTVECAADVGRIEVGVAPAYDLNDPPFRVLVNVAWLGGVAGCVITTVVVLILRRRSRQRLRATAVGAA